MFRGFYNSKIFFFTNDIYVKMLVFYGLLFRFLVATIFYSNTTIYPDSYGFLELAENLLRFDLSGYNGNRSPGYSFLIFLGLGKTWLTVIYQFFIGVIGSVILYKTAKNLKFKAKYSFAIAIFLESFLNVFFYETSILIEPLAVFFIILLMYEISKGYLFKNDIKSDIWVGFIVGYLVLIKPFYVYIGVLLYGAYLLNGFSWKKLIDKKIILLLFSFSAYFGWSYVNKINTGHFVSTTFFGLNLSQNCVYFAEKGNKKYEWISKPYVKYREEYIKADKDVAMAIWEAHEKELKYTHPNFPDLSADLGDYAIQTIKENPKEYFKQVAFRSWFDFWKPSICWNYDEFNFKNTNKIFLIIWVFQAMIITIVTLIFIPVSLGYIFEYFRTGKMNFEIFGSILVWVSSVLQAMVTYGTNDKYRYPFEFIIVLVVILFFRKKQWIPKRLYIFLQ